MTAPAPATTLDLASYCRSIDLETLGTHTDAAVVEIGIIDFKIYPDSILVTNSFRATIRPSIYGSGSAASDFSHTISTLLWWATTQPDVLMKLETEGEWIGTVAKSLQTYLNANKATEIYTRGNFDIAILQHFIRCTRDSANVHHNPMVVPFRQVHDIRSLHAIPKLKANSFLAKPANSHSALVDAMHNITIAAAAYELPISYKPECQFLQSLCLKTTSS